MYNQYPVTDDVEKLLEFAISNGCLVLLIPPVVDFLNFICLEKMSVETTYFKNVLDLLVCIRELIIMRNEDNVLKVSKSVSIFLNFELEHLFGELGLVTFQKATKDSLSKIKTALDMRREIQSQQFLDSSLEIFQDIHLTRIFCPSMDSLLSALTFLNDNRNSFKSKSDTKSSLKKITPIVTSHNQSLKENLEKELRQWFFLQHPQLIPIVEFCSKTVIDNCCKVAISYAEMNSIQVFYSSIFFLLKELSFPLLQKKKQLKSFIGEIYKSLSENENSFPFQVIESFTFKMEKEAFEVSLKEARVYCESTIKQLVDLGAPVDIDEQVKHTTVKLLIEHCFSVCSSQMLERVKDVVKRHLQTRVVEIEKRIKKSTNNQNQQETESSPKKIETATDSFIFSRVEKVVGGFEESNKVKRSSVFELAAKTLVGNQRSREENQVHKVALLKMEKSIFNLFQSSPSNLQMQFIHENNDSLLFLFNNYLSHLPKKEEFAISLQLVLQQLSECIFFLIRFCSLEITSKETFFLSSKKFASVVLQMVCPFLSIVFIQTLFLFQESMGSSANLRQTKEESLKNMFEMLVFCLQKISEFDFEVTNKFPSVLLSANYHIETEADPLFLFLARCLESEIFTVPSVEACLFNSIQVLKGEEEKQRFLVKKVVSFVSLFHRRNSTTQISSKFAFVSLIIHLSKLCNDNDDLIQVFSSCLSQIKMFYK